MDDSLPEGAKEPWEDPEDEARFAAWAAKKAAWMEEILGREHDHVMHAMIPFAIGGSLDLYYYPNGIPGTGIATKELSELPGEGPSNQSLDNYELVYFARAKLNLDDVRREETEFGRAHQRANAVLNSVARYAFEAELNPGETCEFPAEMEEIGGQCLIFDRYGGAEKGREFGLLLLMAVHRDELEFARKEGTAALLAMLREAGHYPYSDLARDSVVKKRGWWRWLQ